MYHLSDYDFHLPPDLIAQYPATRRTDSNLLCLNKKTGHISHRQFSDVLSFLMPGDLLVFNNTKVLPARLFAHKESGGKVELLIERIMTEGLVLAHLRASKSPAPGSVLFIAQSPAFQVVEKSNHLYKMRFIPQMPLLSFLAIYGKVPLPPYIEREPLASDNERYQTVYAKKEGSVAAPTAGLHFDELLLSQLQLNEVQTQELTLHVGAGTFQPVRHENIREHQIHQEWLEVPKTVTDAIMTTKKRGGRVIAVGTTTVRSLETAAIAENKIEPYTGETSLFIYPGYAFKIVDAMITNFHLPKSSLLMLVSAFAGFDVVKQAYQEAIVNGYRFFSYGDAMFIA